MSGVLLFFKPIIEPQHLVRATEVLKMVFHSVTAILLVCKKPVLLSIFLLTFSQANNLLRELAPKHYQECPCLSAYVSEPSLGSRDLLQLHFCWYECLVRVECFYFSYCVSYSTICRMFTFSFLEKK